MSVCDMSIYRILVIRYDTADPHVSDMVNQNTFMWYITICFNRLLLRKDSCIVSVIHSVLRLSSICKFSVFDPLDDEKGNNANGILRFLGREFETKTTDSYYYGVSMVLPYFAN